MDWALILKEVIGWAIPFILTGAVAIYLAPLRNALKKGQDIQGQEQWDKYSESLRARVVILEKDDKEYTKKLGDLIQLVNDNQTQVKNMFEAADKKNTQAFIQIYQRDLIVDGKEYIQAKKITPMQLANYEKRFKQYKAWGGNGDVDPWIKKIRELPVEYPDSYLS